MTAPSMPATAQVSHSIDYSSGTGAVTSSFPHPAEREDFRCPGIAGYFGQDLRLAAVVGIRSRYLVMRAALHDRGQAGVKLQAVLDPSQLLCLADGQD